MSLSIKNRIYLSFLLLVLLFVVNGVITILNINYNKNLNNHISEVVDPSLQTMGEIEEMLVHSKMYATNWVFLRYDQEDKDELVKLQNTVYPELKAQMIAHSAQWVNKNWTDSLDKIYAGFEQLIVTEKEIMAALQKFEDYDDPMSKLGAEEQLEDVVLPKTAELLITLNNIIAFGENIKLEENRDIAKMSKRLWWQIIFLVITMMAIGTFLAVYMAGRIIKPVDKIRLIVNDLGKGIINKVDYKANGDEIGEMVRSVNNLSDKLEATAAFAHEVGMHNYDMPFAPLSDEDILGKALITMRDNIKESDEQLTSTLRELEKRVDERTRALSVTNDVLRTEIHERVRMGKELQGKNKDITDSILYAERLQKAVVPDFRVLQKNFSRFFVFNRQKNIVGGDFYWYHKNRQNYTIACADCTGHGVPGAFMSIIGIDLLNKMIVDQQWKYPSLVLELLDDGLNKIFGGEKESRMNDGMDMSFCVINKVEKKIQFAGAMNPVILVSDGKVQIYKGSRFGLGAYMELSEKRFETQVIDYKEGDMLYMLTDGFQDQFGGPTGKKFMIARLQMFLETIYALPGEEQKNALATMFDEWRGDYEQTDDVMILGIGL